MDAKEVNLVSNPVTTDAAVAAKQGAVQHGAVKPSSCPDADRVEVTRLADQLERSFRGGAWHGPSVSEALDGVDAALAARRIAPGAHTIAELAGHIAFWIGESSRRIDGTPSGSVTDEQNFPSRAAGDDAAWRRTLAELEAAHRSLHATVLALTDERLDGAVAGSDPTMRGLLLGLVQHNAYHAGQIVVLRKVAEASP
jgi:uncharacterized damage-inducible protein DinB